MINRMEKYHIQYVEEPIPRFECKIEQNTVYIDSYNAPELILKLGKAKHGRSLGLDGQVTVIWNGKQVYQGSAQTGWNSWDYYGAAVSMNSVREEMATINASPLKGKLWRIDPDFAVIRSSETTDDPFPNYIYNRRPLLEDQSYWNSLNGRIGN